MIQLARTGVLIPQDWKSDADKTAHLEKVDEIRHQIHNDPRLVATELGDVHDDGDCGPTRAVPR